MTDLEIAVRTIDELVPTMSTEHLRKWQGILKSALLKVEKELTSNSLHVCQVCFYEEWGYRDELPSSWYKKGDAEICFQHSYADAENLLREAGRDVDAFLPPETPIITTEALRVQAAQLPPPEDPDELKLKELMAEL